jgi:hypothetical protein
VRTLIYVGNSRKKLGMTELAVITGNDGVPGQAAPSGGLARPMDGKLKSSTTAARRRRLLRLLGSGIDAAPLAVLPRGKIVGRMIARACGGDGQESFARLAHPFMKRSNSAA